MGGLGKKTGKKMEKVNRAFDFMQARAKSRAAFSIAEMCAASGWGESSVKTYFSKQLKALIEATGNKFLVKPDFTRWTQEEFHRHVTQKREVYTQYRRRKYEHVVSYEFLLPLTREDQLRRALDELFFKDTIEQRLDEIGLKKLETVISRDEGQHDADYKASVVRAISDKFGGYSISHLSGRFRAGDLTSRAEAGQLLAENKRYLIDETTALVRFILPCGVSRCDYEEDFRSINTAINSVVEVDEARLDGEVRTLRTLFFHIFVEAIVSRVRGEDEIWLVETTTRSRRLFVWAKER